VCNLEATAPPEHRAMLPESRELYARCFMVCKIEFATTLAGLAVATRIPFQLKVERGRRWKCGIICSQTNAFAKTARAKQATTEFQL
jgi:hypothetical protein